jgi:hypothetical protein
VTVTTLLPSRLQAQTIVEPLDAEVLGERAGVYVLARLDYGHGCSYELHIDLDAATLADLDDAAALLPAGRLVFASVTDSACLGGRGEVCITWWQVQEVVIVPRAR